MLQLDHAVSISGAAKAQSRRPSPNLPCKASGWLTLNCIQHQDGGHTHRGEVGELNETDSSPTPLLQYIFIPRDDLAPKK